MATRDSQEWFFNVLPDSEGAVVICTAQFTLRRGGLFLAPILFFTKNVIHRDLTFLRKAIEGESLGINPFP
jgi:hypothetical protein